MKFKQPNGKEYEVEPLTPGAALMWREKREANCTDCELHRWASTVCLFGNGPVPAAGMIVGEGPGAVEDQRERPFQGKSGQYLNAVLADLELDREQFYISNATKCLVPRTEKNDAMLKAAVKACAHYLEEEIARVRPRVILAVGNYAYYHFSHKTGITSNRGKEFFHEKSNAIIVPTVHPAYIMQYPDYHDAFVADVEKFKNLIKGNSGPPVKIVEIRTVEDFRAAKKDLWEKPNNMLTFDLETRGLIDYQPWSKVWCMGVTRDGKTSYIIPLEHPESPFLEVFDPEWEKNWPVCNTRIADQYKEVVEGVCDLALLNSVSNHNIKFDLRHIIHFAKRYGLYNKYYELGILGGGLNAIQNN